LLPASRSLFNFGTQAFETDKVICKKENDILLKGKHHEQDY
jgi:hypothetical protein